MVVKKSKPHTKPQAAVKPATKVAPKAAAKAPAKPIPQPKPTALPVAKPAASVAAKPAAAGGLPIQSLEPLTHAPAAVRGYPDQYVPTENDKDGYMNPKQLAYFRDLLLAWRQELVAGNTETIHDLKETSTIEADLTDQATLEYEQTLELRTRDRARKVINKIDEALDRIRSGDFGYCEETGDPIGIGRLLARPIATLSIEAKRRQEKKEVSYIG